jgi:LysM repeat protein
MNKPNPLVPQGTFADKGKSHIRITVFAILAVHVVLLVVLLIAGCNKKETGGQTGDTGLPAQPGPLTNDSPTWPLPPAGGLTSNTGAAGGLIPPPPSNGNTVTSFPPPPPPPPDNATHDPAASGATEHTIVKGDSFWTLSKQYKVGYKAIADANPNVDSTRLKLGQKIKIPAPKTPGTSAAPVNGASSLAPASSNPGAETTYAVKSGDNLIKIAKSFGVTPKELQRANHLPTTKITVGQKLKIPSKTPAAPPEPATPPPGIPASLPDAAAPGVPPAPR